MAVLQLPALFLCLSIASLLISPSHSQACTSQTFTNNKLYTNCTDLPWLNAYLHWTYDTTKSSLSIAFLAPPPLSSGWIAWGINPTGPKMIGTQAVIAHMQFNGSMTVNTFDISSYQVVPSKISFDVSDVSAEYSGGIMKIFATLALPSNTVSVNQVWQVGRSVESGVPQKHAMATSNMQAVGTLELVKSETQSNGSATPSSTTASPGEAKHNGIDRIGMQQWFWVFCFIIYGNFCAWFGIRFTGDLGVCWG